MSNKRWFPQRKYSIYLHWLCKSLKCNHKFLKSQGATGFFLEIFSKSYKENSESRKWRRESLIVCKQGLRWISPENRCKVQGFVAQFYRELQVFSLQLLLIFQAIHLGQLQSLLYKARPIHFFLPLLITPPSRIFEAQQLFLFSKLLFIFTQMRIYLTLFQAKILYAVLLSDSLMHHKHGIGIPLSLKQKWPIDYSPHGTCRAWDLYSTLPCRADDFFIKNIYPLKLSLTGF